MKSYSYKTPLWIVLFMFIINLGYSQTITPKPFIVSPKSPNVSAIEKFGNYTVNLFHGVPEIDIPIFEIKTKNMTVPIKLSYHASGLKVTDVASWVGLGWSLNTGGMVSRKVKGVADELGFLSPAFQFRTPSQISPRTADGYYYLRGLAEGNRDTGPDIFSYSIPGKYGNFLYKDKVSQPVLIPYEPVKVNRLTDPQYSSSFNFHLVDDKGINYFFGRSLTNEDARETSSNQQGGTYASSISSWLLTEMISSDQTDTISFKYNAPKSISLLTETNDYVAVTDAIATYSSSLCTTSSSITSSYTNAQYSVQQKTLKDILFSNGKIEFIPTTGDRDDISAPALKAINVYSKVKNTYQLLKTVNFYYSYFTGYNTSKLKLDSISVKSPDQAISQTYRFDYDRPTSIPNVNSKSKDYWGYFNNKGNTTLVPQKMIRYNIGSSGTDVQIGGADREPNPDEVQTGILKRIQYPTGGYSVFEYESNKYSNGVKEQLGGGVRIKAIYSYAKTGTSPVIKSYLYGTESQPESGLGILNSIRNISFSARSSTVYSHSAYGGHLYLACTYKNSTYSGDPTLNVNDFDDVAVYYPHVTEIIGSPMESIGKKTYLFSNVSDRIITPMQDEKLQVESFHWMRGKLLKYMEFESLGGGQFKLKRERNDIYSVFNPVTVENVGLVISQVNIQEGPFLEGFYYGDSYPLPYSYSFYNVYTGLYNLSSSKEKTYDSASAFETTTNYTYNEFAQLTNSRSVRSNADTLISNYKYATDYALVNPQSQALGIANLKNLNIVSVPVENTVSIKLASGETRLIKGEIKTFNSDKPSIKEEYFAEANQPVANYVPSFIDGAGNFTMPSNFVRRLSYTDYDQANNLTAFTVDPGSKKALIWGYRKSLIIGEVQDASPNQIAYTSFEEEGKGNWNYNESGVKLSPDNVVSGKYVYDFSISNQISRSGLPNGIYTVTYWAKKACAVNGTAPLAVGRSNSRQWTLYTHSVSPVNGIITVTSADALMDELRLFPSGSFMTTYSHTPLLNMTSSVDQNDNVQVFEYDGLQRLSSVKDFNGHLIKDFKYSYPNPLKLSGIPKFYYNNEISADFTRTGCPINQYGTIVKYVVPKGVYYSDISQSDAQNKAQTSFDVNGQQYANLNGECRSKSEVKWEPINKYCQVLSTGNSEPGLQGYFITFASATNSNDYTVVTVTRPSAAMANAATVNFEINFNSSNKISASISFEIGQTTNNRTVGVYPYKNDQRNGGRIVSVATENKFYFTGVSVYAQRQKRVGGEVVLVEPNLKGVGTGTYFDVVLSGSDGLSACERGFTDSSPTYASYANCELTGYFFKSCPTGQAGSREPYTVRAGSYTSSISQADADAKAQAEITANGQANANLLGTCYN